MVYRQKFYHGAVSLFMVIFSMLVITVITVGFLRLMVADQRQASNSDLAQSAYDSALAGVEDAKRAILSYQRACAEDSTVCAPRKAQLASTECNAGLQSVVSAPVDAQGRIAEVPVQRSGGSVDDTRLNQAYTCVIVALGTDEYLGTVAANESKVVPLKGMSAFDTVRISWFSKQDISNEDGAIDRPSAVPSNMKLLRQDRWPDNRPSVLRTQFMQFGDAYVLGDFDAETASGESNANTIFLYPSSSVNTSAVSIADIDGRRIGTDPYPAPASTGSAPYPSSCRADIASGGYACTTTLRIPTPVGGGARTAFLRLTPFYKATHFKIELMNGASIVQFDGVQPTIDSTGRANDLFRRVEARVDIEAADFPFPEAAVDISGNLCKDFTVTDDAYIAGTCTP